MKAPNFKKGGKIIAILLLILLIGTIGNFFRLGENPFLIGKYYLFEGQDNYQVDEDLQRRHDDKDYGKTSNGVHEMKRLREKYEKESPHSYVEQELIANAGRIFVCINTSRDECKFKKNNARGKTEEYTVSIEEGIEYFEEEGRMLVLNEIFEEYLAHLDDFSGYDHMSVCNSESTECDFRTRLLYLPGLYTNDHLYGYLLLIEGEEERFDLYERLYTKMQTHIALTNGDFAYSYITGALLSIFEDHIYDETSAAYSGKYALLFSSSKFDADEIFTNTIKQKNIEIHYALNVPDEDMEEHLFLYKNIFSRAANDAARDLIENKECSTELYEKYDGSELVVGLILDGSLCGAYKGIIERVEVSETRRIDMIERLEEREEKE